MLKSCYKVLSSAVILSLLAGTAAYANADNAVGSAADNAASAPVQKPATPFSDVKAGHWAEKHIAKLNLQGIIQGKGAGKFGTNDNVSQEDAVILAIRLMGKDSQAKQDDAVVFPENFKVSEYAKGYIVLALQEGLLDRTEEFKRAEADKSEWGKRTASREWVTKLLIRAINQTKLAEELVDASSQFTDSGDITEGYSGYVNAAVNLKLMNGVSATKFDPKGLITRAMIAKMYSLAESYYPVNYANQSTGLITGLTENSITLYDTESNSEKSYPISKNALYYRFDSESIASASELTRYAKALVIASEDGAAYIETLDDDAKVETLRGEVIRVVPDESKLWMFVDNKPAEIAYSSTLEVKDSNGNKLQVTDLAADATIEVTRDTFRTQPLAVSIQVQGAKINKSGTGKITAVSDSSLTIESEDGSVTETWGIAESVLVTWNREIKSIADLAVGDIISYEIKAGLATKINVTSTVVGKTVTGTLQHIDSDSKTINYKLDASTNTLSANYLAANVQVIIEGINQATVSDLVRGDQVKLTINDQDAVTKIQVVNRRVETVNGASILNYDADSKTLTILDSAGKPTAVQLTGNTKIEYNGSSLALSSASNLLLKNRKVTIGFTEGVAVYVNLVNSYTGTLSDINQTTNQLTISFETGGTMKIPFDQLSVEIYEKTSSTLSDLKTGDRITALLGPNQDKVVAIQLHRIIQQEVVSVDTSNKKIKLKAQDGSVNEYSVGTNMRLLNDKGTSVGLNVFGADQVVNVQFVGRLPGSIQQVEVTFGKVTAVGSEQLTVETLSGSKQNIKLGSNFRVIRNGSSSTNVSSVSVGDYVDIRKNEEEALIVTVNSGTVRKFRSYIASSKEMFVFASSLNDNNVRYVLSDDTRVIINGSSSSMQELKNGDEITLYFINGKIALIVKS
ncbi:S-layer homology domain-containing protein [Paenibacillus sp. GCM10012307]